MTYFRVSAPLPIWLRTDISAMPVLSPVDPSTEYAPYSRYGFTTDRFVRFESLSQDDANRFASDIYARERTVAVVDEVTR